VKASVKIGSLSLDFEVDENDMIEVWIGDQPICAVDCFYMNDDNEDPNYNAPRAPHVNIGYHEENDEWEVLRYVPLMPKLVNDLQAMRTELETR